MTTLLHASSLVVEGDRIAADPGRPVSWMTVCVGFYSISGRGFTVIFGRSYFGEPKWEPTCTALSHVRRRPASVVPGECHARRHRASSGNGRELIWEQEVAGSHTAI